MDRMKGGTLFSGIGAPELAGPQVDWRWCAEIDPFASAVHKARFPRIPNLGDVTEIDPDAVEPVDVVVFGSPCQSFSVAGKRLGLDDPRGNLALLALRLVAAIRPRWFLFENVPGLLSSDDGRDFGAFLGTVEQCGYGWAYRTLDAQYFGVAQRRRRVFVVGCLGDWRGAAAVLFEPESLRRHPAPRREKGEGVAAKSPCGSQGGIDREERHTLVAHALTAEGFDASEDGTGRGAPLIPLLADPISAHEQSYTHEGSHNFRLRNVVPVQSVQAVREKKQNGIGIGEEGDEMFTLTGRDQHAVAYGIRSDAARNGEAKTPSPDAEGRIRLRDPGFNILEDRAPTIDAGQPHTIAFTERARSDGRNLETQDELAYALCNPGSGGRTHSRQLQQGMTVRRLTPTECERLQGFPDGWTAISWRGKPAADGPRYRALGNAMCVNVMRWLLGRVA